MYRDREKLTTEDFQLCISRCRSHCHPHEETRLIEKSISKTEVWELSSCKTRVAMLVGVLQRSAKVRDKIRVTNGNGRKTPDTIQTLEEITELTSSLQITDYHLQTQRIY